MPCSGSWVAYTIIGQDGAIPRHASAQRGCASIQGDGYRIRFGVAGYITEINAIRNSKHKTDRGLGIPYRRAIQRGYGYFSDKPVKSLIDKVFLNTHFVIDLRADTHLIGAASMYLGIL
jgi:hypothetical protein